MELEVSGQMGAERHEHTVERRGYRNGYRERPWDTRVARSRWETGELRGSCPVLRELGERPPGHSPGR